MEKLHYQNSLKELQSWEAQKSIDFSRFGGLLDLDFRNKECHDLDVENIVIFNEFF